MLKINKLNANIEKNKTKYEKYPLYKSHIEHGFIEPLISFTPSIGISEIEKVGQNEYVVSSLKDKSLRKLIFDDFSNVKEDIIFKNKIGRIRDIQVHPGNGKIYFLGENALWLMEKN